MKKIAVDAMGGDYAPQAIVEGVNQALADFSDIEIQILTRFGISLNFNECVFCHRVGQAFDFSFKYGACLCPDHYHEDEKRCHLNPNIPYLLNQFQAIDFETLETISLKPEIKQELRQFIDQLYEEYVGIHLKSKKFIDSLADWGQLLKEEKK